MENVYKFFINYIKDIVQHDDERDEIYHQTHNTYKVCII